MATMYTKQPSSPFLVTILAIVCGSLIPVISYASLVKDMRALHEQSREERDMRREQFRQEVLQKRKEFFTQLRERKERMKGKLQREEERMQTEWGTSSNDNEEDAATTSRTFHAPAFVEEDTFGSIWAAIKRLTSHLFLPFAADK